jgi:hypothetical protein
MIYASMQNHNAIILWDEKIMTALRETMRENLHI